MGNYKEEVLNIASAWDEKQLDSYIKSLEERIIDTHMLLKELKAIRRRKTHKSNYDTGSRGGI